jgi:hypothetical protein
MVCAGQVPTECPVAVGSPLVQEARGSFEPSISVLEKRSHTIGTSASMEVSTGDEVVVSLTRKNGLAASPYADAIRRYPLRYGADNSHFSPAIPIFSFSDNAGAGQSKEPVRKDAFDWNAALRESLLFLGAQQTLRLAIEADTRAGLKGSYWKDYFRTVKNLRGWKDGDKFATNYIGHPIMGAVAGFIQIHNDPAGLRQELGSGSQYRKSRLKALAWSTLYSVHFELGPLGEASIGNVGKDPRKSTNHPMAYVDLVVTPVIGTGWLIGEDAVDRYLIARIERWTKNHTVRVLARSFLNPARSLSNLLRLKKPWRRDTRQMS